TKISAESELLLEILGPRIVGGLFLSMLGVLPDAILYIKTELFFSRWVLTLICLLVFVSVSGLSGNVATARSQVSVGMDLLAGSTVMLPTCDIRDTFDALMPCTKTSLFRIGQTSDHLTINLRDKRFDVTRQSSRRRNFHVDPEVYSDP
ncbi:unnamed protein product, partial [Brassica oleracea var. botrytis]